MQILVIILGAVSTITLIISTIQTIRFKRFEFNEKKAEVTRKKEEEANEILRKKDLNDQFDARNSIIMRELDVVKSLMNDLGDLISETNARIDEGNQIRDAHIHESSVISDFLRVYNRSLEQSLVFWYIDDERYKLILKNWGAIIRTFLIEHLDGKVNKVDNIIEYDPEAHMNTLITEFENLCASLIKETCSASTFKDWIVVNNLHAKSKVFALAVKNNNMSTIAFNKKAATYIFYFSKEFIKVTADWIKELKRKAA